LYFYLFFCISSPKNSNSHISILELILTFKKWKWCGEVRDRDHAHMWISSRKILTKANILKLSYKPQHNSNGYLSYKKLLEESELCIKNFFIWSDREAKLMILWIHDKIHGIYVVSKEKKEL
jgi:hypothetical protein